MLHPGESQCWRGGGGREPGAAPAGHCPPLLGGAWPMGPPQSCCETRPTAPSQQGQPLEPPPAAMPSAQLGTHMAPGGSQHPQKVLVPGQPAAHGCRDPRGRRATVPGDTSPWITLQVTQDQGEASPGHPGGCKRGAGGVDAGMLLPPCSFQHTTEN